MFSNIEVRTLLVLVILLTIPGWAVLAFSGASRLFTVLQRWCLAVALSIAFYPVLMYFLRMVPGLRMGTNKWILLLAALALMVLWALRKDWRAYFRFQRLDGMAAAILLAVLFTRLWMAHLYPYPAWSDSLHHTLLTQITAAQGRLPVTMEPYAPTPVAMYHLGLYAISSVLMLLAKIPAHTALVWTAQALNGLCGLGVFLVLDRKIGRVGAIVGTVVVGLFSFQPAWYINWGRFTQVASQSILLVAWLITWEAVAVWRKQEDTTRLRWGLVLLSSLLNAGVFLLHFRVAFFYLPLLAVTILYEWLQARDTKSVRRMIAAMIVIGLVSLALVSSSVFSAARAYYDTQTEAAAARTMEASEHAATTNYYAFALDTVPVLAAQPWLLAAGGAALIFCLIRRSRFTALVAIWTGLMVLEGLAYLLNIPLLMVTNMGAVLILLYLPIGLVIGDAAEGLWRSPLFQPSSVRQAALMVFLFSAFLASHARVSGIEQTRFFLSGTDLQAMEWIKGNTDPGALFAINTYFWMPAAPHGIDGGFWIPYFAERETTAGTMLFNLGPPSYTTQVIHRSLVVEDLRLRYQSADRLCEEGIDYIYLGSRGDPAGELLSFERLSAMPDMKLAYQNTHVSIFQPVCR